MIKVLLVEDDTLLARQFKRQIEVAGYEALWARHAGEAMARLDEAMPDVIILDLILPVRSGFALLHELQSYDDTASVPIVVCSSSASQTKLAELAPYGVKRLVDKVTMVPGDIVAAVRAVV